MGTATAALGRGFSFTSSLFTQDALQWLWAYTVELPPHLFKKPARTPLRAAPRSLGVRRLEPGVAVPAQRRMRQSAARTGVATPTIAPIDAPARRARAAEALEGIDASDVASVRRGARRVLRLEKTGDAAERLDTLLCAALAQERPFHEHAWLAALQIETSVARGAHHDALAQLSALLDAHAELLKEVRALGDAGAMQRLRHKPGLAVLYHAAKAVLGEGRRRVQAELRTGPSASAPALAAWLWANPLALALVQPVFPKVCQAIYTILAALPNPVGAVRALDAHRAGLVAAALANRHAPETAAQVVLECSRVHGMPPEPLVRRVLRVLIEGGGRRVVIAPLVQLVDTDEAQHATLRLLATYDATHGDADGVARRLARLPEAMAAPMRVHTSLLLAAHAGDVEGVEALYETSFGRALRDAYERPDAEPYVYHLLLAYAARDDYLGARGVLDAYKMHRAVPERMYLVLLRIAARHADADAALHLVLEMEASLVTSTTILHLVRALGAARLADRAASVMAYYRAQGVVLGRRVYNALLNAYVEAGHWSAAFGTFRYLQQHPRPAMRPDAAVYTTMLKAHVLRGAPVSRVLRLLWSMRRHGLVPDERTYALVLQSACDARDLRLAESLFELMDEALVPSHGGATLHHYTILLHALLRAGKSRRARHYLDAMRARGMEPSPVTYGVLIRSYAESDPTSHVAGELAMQLTKSAAAERRTTLGEGVAYENMLLPLIHVHSRRGELEAADALFAQLRAACAPASPSLRAWTSLLNAYRYAGDVEGALRVWDELYLHTIERVPSVGADQRSMLCFPLSIIMATLTHDGQFKRIAQIWQRVKRDGFAFDAHNFNQLAVALACSGRVWEALQVIEQVLPERPPALESALAPRMLASDALRDEEAYARDPLYQPPAPSAEGPWAPQVASVARPPNRRAAVADVDPAAATLDGDAPDSAWLDPALLAPSHAWFATYDTLREVCAAMDRMPKKTRARKRVRTGVAGADALAAPPELVPAAEALHAFPIAAARLAEYEQRAARWDAP